MAITKKFLTDLGIEPEVAEKIFAERSTEIDAEKKKYSDLESQYSDIKTLLDETNSEFDKLKQSKATAEDWEKKYKDIVSEYSEKEKERERIALEAQERAEFDRYFAEKEKEWSNPFIADGYFAKFREAKSLEENKSKMTADILHELTKDDATAFKMPQPIVNLKGSGGGLPISDIDDARINAIMGIKTE